MKKGLSRFQLLIVLIFAVMPRIEAFYGFKKVSITESELSSSKACSIVTSGTLIAYNCATSFKVFKNDQASSIYSTTRAVSAVTASKLTTEPFISFIEATKDTDTSPGAYAYLKIVGTSGVVDKGLSSTFLPNQSVYIGDGLMIKIKSSKKEL